LASLFLYNDIKDAFDITTINYTRKNAIAKSGMDFKFISQVLKHGRKIKKYAKKSDAVYLTISQSLLGNLKDLYFIYKIGKKNRKKVIIHLHGGYFDQYLKKTPFFVKFLNKILFKDIKSGVVLGESLIKCLTPILPKEKICIVNNFFDNDLLIDNDTFLKKWDSPKITNLLFLSNLMIQKGYLDLLDGFILVPEDVRKNFVLNFAGDFENSDNKNEFLDRIKNHQNINYLGVIEKSSKKDILQKSHALILPTYYTFEGQPLSIIESYASGLVVFTTNHSGIVDIFKNDINGIEIQKKDPNSIKDAIIKFNNNFSLYKNIAQHNLKYSKEFSGEKFIKKITNFF